MIGDAAYEALWYELNPIQKSRYPPYNCKITKIPGARDRKGRGSFAKAIYQCKDSV